MFNNNQKNETSQYVGPYDCTLLTQDKTYSPRNKVHSASVSWMVPPCWELRQPPTFLHKTLIMTFIRPNDIIALCSQAQSNTSDIIINFVVKALAGKYPQVLVWLRLPFCLAMIIINLLPLFSAIHDVSCVIGSIWIWDCFTGKFVWTL